MTCNIKGIPLLVVNTHLESMKESSETRTAQLKTITRLMLQHEGPAMVGGDLNMRDREQKDAFLNAGGADDAMTDAYFFFNRPADARVTWELPDTPQAKGRFDMIYHNLKGIEIIHNSHVRQTDDTRSRCEALRPPGPRLLSESTDSRRSLCFCLYPCVHCCPRPSPSGKQTYYGQ